jgi:hypothetical protein
MSWNQDRPDDTDETRWLRQQLRELQPLLQRAVQTGSRADEDAVQRKLAYIHQESRDFAEMADAWLTGLAKNLRG